MNEKFIDSFINSVTTVMANFGIKETAVAKIHKRESFTCKYNIITVVGLCGDIKGNVALTMSYDTAKKFASAMMMGMEVTELDEMCVSALGEITNMICGQAIMELSTLNQSLDITPPTIIHGNSMKAIISQVETIGVDINSSIGSFELNLGLEI